MARGDLDVVYLVWDHLGGKGSPRLDGIHRSKETAETRALDFGKWGVVQAWATFP